MTTTDQAPLEVPVTLAGREIYCRMPSPEQLLVWQRTVRRLTDSPVDASWTGSEVMAALDRLRTIIDSLISRADVDWLDDQFLVEKVTFKDLAPFITEVAEAFAKKSEEKTGGNPPAKKTKATRKKAAL